MEAIRVRDADGHFAQNRASKWRGVNTIESSARYLQNAKSHRQLVMNCYETTFASTTVSLHFEWCLTCKEWQKRGLL